MTNWCRKKNASISFLSVDQEKIIRKGKRGAADADHIFCKSMILSNAETSRIK